MSVDRDEIAKLQAAPQADDTVQFRGVDDTSEMLAVRKILESKAVYLDGRSIAAIVQACAPQAQPEQVEMSPDFTDTARAALLWVLWHHQGGSSPVGQPIRYALGMGAHERLNAHQVAEAKRWAAITGSQTSEFHGQAQPEQAAQDADGEAFRAAARLGLTLRFYGGCAQSSVPGTPCAYETVTGSDRAEAMRQAVKQASDVIDAALATQQAQTKGGAV